MCVMPLWLAASKNWLTGASQTFTERKHFLKKFFTSECRYLNHIVCSFVSYVTEFYAPAWLKVNVQSTVLHFPPGARKLFKYQFCCGLSRPQMWRENAQLTSEIRLALSFSVFWILALPSYFFFPVQHLEAVVSAASLFFSRASFLKLHLICCF